MICTENCASSEDESKYGKNLYKNEYEQDRRLIQVPSFNWLSYTRYKMPRISRKFKLKVCKI
jgi:hypothetical protein